MSLVGTNPIMVPNVGTCMEFHIARNSYRYDKSKEKKHNGR